jgi:hypothetical protein
MFAEDSWTLPASIIRAMIGAAKFYQTKRRNNTEDSHVHTYRRENHSLMIHLFSTLKKVRKSLIHYNPNNSKYRK